MAHPPPRRVLVAPDKFKGTLSAEQAASALAAGVVEAHPEAQVSMLPLADGGDGTLDVILSARGGQRLTCTAANSLGRPRQVPFVMLDDGTAVIESAAICGLAPEGLLEPERATTHGVGTVMVAALESRARRLVVALGGSGTVDGGLGLLGALGGRALTASGLPVPAGGMALWQLASLDLTPARKRLGGLPMQVLCDVSSPLLGPDGARLYMPQKGADEALVEQLEAGLTRLVAVVGAQGADAQNRAGAGAAGGLGYALALLGGDLRGGAAAICDMTGFDEALKGCDLVVTGEGRLDSQTLQGKVVAEVVARAARRGVPVAVVCGVDALDEGALQQAGAQVVVEAAAGRVATAEDLRRTGRALAALTSQSL